MVLTISTERCTVLRPCILPNVLLCQASIQGCPVSEIGSPEQPGRFAMELLWTQIFPLHHDYVTKLKGICKDILTQL